MSPVNPPNAVTAARAGSQWAQLTRLAGDRAAILFEELRKRVGTIPGLVEELRYDGVEKRWTPHYRLGEEALFAAPILPAALEATTTLDAFEREKLLGSRRIGLAMKQSIARAPTVGGSVHMRVRLNSQATVRAFAALIVMKSKLVSSRVQKSGPGGRRSHES